ncbi:uncharacterized protein PHACADRAFT_139428 [Phanerochaete carnosa HHB-10118-sp]|uniref:DUF2855 family protein n=1 Tax=Phanerochaete carnosa (strain HHB-10118-sp) TaxID=650164 RepID=K5V5L7_PHACS|nr:uncharacterized protein PHACADRAFT_139428 [Phanerochaete carnosa HHB-10118-sp]EKM57956.1 hypothetical protein PHACADRAFT_139428 [Phanerochaete carnosa HHB-10118-sp]
MENLTLCVSRPSSGQDPHKPVLVKSQLLAKLPENHVLIKIDRFGFSANNITYQALGEAPHFRYFDFHLAPRANGATPETHGLIPVWGFGTVVESSHPRIGVGERVYGYFAPTKYLLVPVSPSDVNKFSFYIPRPHLPPGTLVVTYRLQPAQENRRPYNQVIRCVSDDQYDPSPLAEDLTMLYRPLFWTAFWCENWLNAFSYRGADSFLISSASAKTAFCLAYLLDKRRKAEEKAIKVVGLTSECNIAFTSGLKLYDSIVTLESSGQLKPSTGKWLYIDVAGNDKLNKRIAAHFGGSGSLVACVQLGLTNLSPSAPAASSTKFTTNTTLSAPDRLSGPFETEQFFMPEWLAVQRKKLRVDDIRAMQTKAWQGLVRDGKDWVRIEHVRGGPDIERAYRKVAEQGTDPKIGMIWSLWNDMEFERRASPKL